MACKVALDARIWGAFDSFIIPGAGPTMAREKERRTAGATTFDAPFGNDAVNKMLNVLARTLEGS